MTLSGKEKAALRGEAHHLTAVVHVGKEGLTPTVFQSLDDALRTATRREDAVALVMIDLDHLRNAAREQGFDVRLDAGTPAGVKAGKTHDIWF